MTIDRSMPVFTDLDDVALNFMGGFSKAASLKLGRTLDPRLADSWNLSAWMGVDDYIPHLMEFLGSEDFGRLEAKVCAARVLPAIAAAGHPLYAITSSSVDPLPVQRRRANILNLYGPIFQDIVFVPLNMHKRTALATLAETVGRTGIWIEDNHTNARDGAGLGFETYVVRTGHNRLHEAFCDDPLLTWIDNLYPVADRLGISIPEA